MMGTLYPAPILILEDEPLIAMDLELMLSSEGICPVELAGSCAAAEAWLAGHTPSIAIVDISLKDGSCVDLARELLTRKVPLIVCSGAQKSDIDPVFKAGIWLPKPCQANELAAVVRGTLAAA